MRAASPDASGWERRRVAVEGVVQGVGFRPFVYRLATELGLAGWVQNTSDGVTLEIEGYATALNHFVGRLNRDRPSLCHLVEVVVTPLDPLGAAAGGDAFAIRASGQGNRRVALLPDVATCPECLRELFDPADRRHRYPFINCTHCGPRYSVVEALPFDRANTVMRLFPLCAACQAEYGEPSNRRFHAQLIACADCGPRLSLWDRDGRVLAERDEALQAAAVALAEGRILALKGVGGYQLLADARRDEVVERLRRRKHRASKPFAIMFRALEDIEAVCRVTDEERRLLQSPEAPIVLLRRRAAGGGSAGIAPLVAPGNPNLGTMLPYSPLHHLLLAATEFPVVATSGNASEEPICVDEDEALARLGEIADVFLVHNRPIVRRLDDSVARVILGREMVIRRARGYAPTPIRMGAPLPPILAVGGHLKSTVAMSHGRDILLSPHIGDLDSVPACDAFRLVVEDFRALYGQAPACVARDLHPDYRSTHYAAGQAGESVPVQHHVAHVLSCLADNELDVPCLGVSWDGTGFGTDGTIWGGEWFRVRDGRVRRVASLRPFRLPGGERAVREPRRTALGLLYALAGDALFTRGDVAVLQSFTEEEQRVLQTMLTRGLNAPLTSSMGRLFDAVAAMLGFCAVAHFEGEAAMALEYAAQEVVSRPEPAFAMTIQSEAAAAAPFPRWRLDWGGAVAAMLAAQAAGRARAELAAQFHHALVDAVVDMARRVGEDYVVLTGGCFQNAFLLEQSITRLRAAGFKPLWHRRIPPNDGGLALGQVVGAARHLADVE